MTSSTDSSDLKDLPKDASQAGDIKSISPLADFLAGGLVSAISKIIVYPMETKVLLLALGEHAATDPARLWHGVAIKAWENFLYNGFLWYLKERIRPPPSDPTRPDKRPPPSFWGAFCVSCACILLIHPMSNVIVGMQATLGRQAPPASAMEVARAIVEEQGIGGFFSGWRFSIALRIGSALTLVVYDFLRSRLSSVVGDDISSFVAGLLGRLSEVYLCHPLKTMRSRQQRGQSLLASMSLASLVDLWSGVGTMAVADAMKIGVRMLLIERTRVWLHQILLWIQRQNHPDDRGCRSTPFSLTITSTFIVLVAVTAGFSETCMSMMLSL
eukprot:TRINITY_DN66303_c0_g1_i1.p1 TRINITY_DN66303_c0_g1~~TRINITY_DN66303_c0_g1_i1.p1  ORF type:complete len:328 (+),score=35.39 TRINITY_DN66303_c0_g1_i1:143-1126(+)